MTRLFLALLGLLVLPSLARAGQPIDFFRVTCLPERGYFAIEHKPIDNANVFWGESATPDGQLRALNAWRKNGFYEGSFNYSCRMTQGAYSAKVSRAEFSERRCGAAPQARVTITLDSSPVVSDVVLGTDCWGNNSVSSIEIVEGHDGWASSDMTMCFYKDGYFPLGCNLISQVYGKLGSSDKVDQDRVDSTAKTLGRQ